MKALSGSGISSFKTAIRLNRDEAAARQSIRPPRMPAEDATDSVAHVDPAAAPLGYGIFAAWLPFARSTCKKFSGA